MAGQTLGTPQTMPELPDVEGFRRVLARAAGRRITRVDVRDAGVVRGTSASAVKRVIPGHAFGTPRRHGKWLVAPLRTPGRRHRTEQPSVVFHFGMTGALVWTPDAEEPHDHDRVIFVTDDGWLRFRDMRKLQGLRLASDDTQVDEILRDTGPDAGQITLDALHGRLTATRRQLKPALMDQTVVAGLGNLLVDEILWRARLNPARTTDELTRDDYARLRRRMRAVIRSANPTGRVPDHPSWLTGHRDASGGRCPRCGNTLAGRRVGGRRTVWCPNCQPA
jgi:formamidopyrimidine-DNA glycosylase